jgi:hypothetical protein
MQPTSTTWTTVSGMDVQIHGFDQFSLGIKNMNSKAVNLEFDLGWKRSEEFHRVVGVLSLHNGCHVDDDFLVVRVYEWNATTQHQLHSHRIKNYGSPPVQEESPVNDW